MITVYKVKYHPATVNTGARFTVTRMDDKRTYRTAYNYGALRAECHAIHEAFGEDTARLEFAGRMSKDAALYAVSH